MNDNTCVAPESSFMYGFICDVFNIVILQFNLFMTMIFKNKFQSSNGNQSSDPNLIKQSSSTVNFHFNESDIDSDASQSINQ
jgi:hypothetical protein